MNMREAVKAGLLMLCLIMMSDVKAYATEPVTSKTVYEYGEEIEVNITKDIPVVPGTNYKIKVTYTGIDGEGKNLKPITIYYEKVLADQCVLNIQAPYKAKNVDDRSGLLYEVTTPGVTDSREFSVAAIDDVLTVIVGGNAILEKIEVTPEEPKKAGEKPTIYLIGDSLVQTYRSNYYPMTGWGQMLPLFFTDDVNIVNRAIGGRSTMNFINQGRLNDVLLSVRPGDYVFVTFGHNDGGGVAGRACSVKDYKNYLEEYYVEGVRQRGGNIVLVTLGNQNIFSKDGEVLQSYPEYVNAMKEAAAEKDCPLIDLNGESKEFFKLMRDKYGSDVMKDVIFNSARAGIYDNYLDGSGDSTHFQKYGATKLAEFVAEGVKELALPGISDHYIAPVKAGKIPGNVGKVKLNTSKYDKKYFHMDWKAVKGADFYEIERASLNSEGFLTGFEHCGYAGDEMFADPEKNREEGVNYAYRVYAVNEAGRSEKPSDICWGTSDKDLIEEFKGRLERGEYGAPKEEIKAEPEDASNDLPELMNPEEEPEESISKTKKDKSTLPIAVMIIIILAVAAGCIVVVTKTVKNRGNKQKNS